VFKKFPRLVFKIKDFKSLIIPPSSTTSIFKNSFRGDKMVFEIDEQTKKHTEDLLKKMKNQ